LDNCQLSYQKEERPELLQEQSAEMQVDLYVDRDLYVAASVDAEADVLDIDGESRAAVRSSVQG
jgi:hypothetical protein